MRDRIGGGVQNVLPPITLFAIEAKRGNFSKLRSLLSSANFIWVIVFYLYFLCGLWSSVRNM